MALFKNLYERAILWAAHPHAERYLGGLSFIEAIFFPVMPEVMLAPMCLATPRKAGWFALITTLASVAGGLLGYAIGYFAIDAITPWLQDSRYWGAFQRAEQWFDQWGVWAIFIAGFSPIPYKVFTVAAGGLSMALLPFTLASFVGRGLRFFLVAGLMRWGGEKMERKLMHYVDVLGWLCIGLAVVAYFWFSR